MAGAGLRAASAMRVGLTVSGASLASPDGAFLATLLRLQRRLVDLERLEDSREAVCNIYMRGSLLATDEHGAV